MSRETMERLAASPLMAGLSAAELELVAEPAVEKPLRKRQMLFREGEPAAALHLVLAGQVKLTQLAADGQEVIVRIVGSGGLLAAVAVFAETVYPATARVLEEGRALLWPRPVLTDLLLRVPRLALNALGEVSTRLLELQDRFRELATERVAQRVARALLRLVAQAGRRTEEGVLIDLPLSRADLAALTGTTLFTVSRLLSEWETNGIVAVGRQRVVVRSPHALVALAEDLPPPR